MEIIPYDGEIFYDNLGYIFWIIKLLKSEWDFGKEDTKF